MDVRKWPGRRYRRESGGERRCARGARGRRAFVGARNCPAIRRGNARYRRRDLDCGGWYGRELRRSRLDAYVLLDQQRAMRMLVGGNEVWPPLILRRCFMAMRWQTRAERAQEREQTRGSGLAEPIL
jgi:hypothetical protein